jgi:hypothetical protein
MELSVQEHTLIYDGVLSRVAVFALVAAGGTSGTRCAFDLSAERSCSSFVDRRGTGAGKHALDVSFAAPRTST